MVLLGLSLAFSHTAGKYIGDLENIGFRNVLAAPSVGSPRIPDLLFAVYQGMFAAITVAIAVGAVAERGRMLPCVVFMFIWSTLIYDPIACWTWNPSGWVYKMEDLILLVELRCYLLWLRSPRLFPYAGQAPRPRSKFHSLFPS